MNSELSFYELVEKRHRLILVAYLILYFWTLGLLVTSILSDVIISLFAILNAFGLLALTSLASKDKATYSNFQRAQLFLLRVAMFKGILLILSAVVCVAISREFGLMRGRVLIGMNTLFEVVFLYYAFQIGQFTSKIIKHSEEAYLFARV